MRRGVIICVLAVFLLPATAHAAFPGQNGKIVFVDSRDGNQEIYTANPDGTGVTRLTFTPNREAGPHWSPDGRKIAFLRSGPPVRGDIWVMNADGSDQVSLGLCGQIGDCVVGEPAWSPTARRSRGIRRPLLVWRHLDRRRGRHEPGHRSLSRRSRLRIRQVVSGRGADRPQSRPRRGTDLRKQGAARRISSTRLTNGLNDYNTPDWSPDATRLAASFFDLSNDTGPWLVTMNRDGTDQTTLREGASPVWSPDGQQTPSTSAGPPDGIWAMSSDGADPGFVTRGAWPDWQPIPINSYPRPKGASPIRMSLVTAYSPCATPIRPPNRTDGPPLAFPSCSPTQKESHHLTVGTGDSNGLPARNEGHVLLKVITGNPSTPADEADVAIEFFSDDIFNADPIADYDGELRTKMSLRITDRDNSPAPNIAAGTTQTIPIAFDTDCAPTADPQEGFSCSSTTTVDALVPSAIKEGRRALWELEQVVVYDGGEDGNPDTLQRANRAFARQGVFIP